MTTEAWIGISSIIVTVAMFLLGGVITLFSYLIRTDWTELKARMTVIEERQYKIADRLTRIETVLTSRGIMPNVAKYPSPTPTKDGCRD